MERSGKCEGRKTHTPKIIRDIALQQGIKMAMKFLSTFKITKGFNSWLKMHKDIEPDLNDLGIKILWAGTNSDETKVFDVTEVKDPSKFEVLTKREDITQKRIDAGVELESQEVIETIAKDYWAIDQLI